MSDTKLPRINVSSMLFGYNRRLSHIRRFSSFPVIRTENVAEHTHYVLFYSMLIAHEIESLGDAIDWRLLTTSVSIHDLDESLSGDVIRHVKRFSPVLHREWKKMSKEMVQILSDDLGIQFVKYWESDKDLNCVEGQIIALSDFLAVLSYTMEEYYTGNQYMGLVVQKVLNNLVQFFKLAGDEGFMIHPVINRVLQDSVVNIKSVKFPEHRLISNPLY